MQGDFTRDTFDPVKHYQRVLMQQGRVQLDADWNEQGAIATRRDATTTRDLVGCCGGPDTTAGFAIFRDPTRLTASDKVALTARFGLLPTAQQPISLSGATPTFALATAKDFFLSPGRYYVDGIQCENESATPFSRQPDRPPATPLSDGQSHLIYLDVWHRHLTPLDDPAIRESALGGTDTATRLKTVWQVRAVPHTPAAGESACAAANALYTTLTAPSTGRLKAGIQVATNPDDPCQLPETAGYKGLENQLYRVEIHQGSHDANGNPTTPSWKWSRENGSVITRITHVANVGGKGILTVTSLGRDEPTSFRKGSFVEILNDALELEGIPGQLLEIEEVNPDALTVTLVALVNPLAPGGFPPTKLRRWEQHGTVSASAPLALEAGIEIAFESAAARFRTGDYWLIPARTATADAPAGDIEWPRELDAAGEPQQDKPLLRLPHGGQHHYCRLGVVTVAGDVIADAAITDCRCLWPPLAAARLVALGGDGQETMPDLVTKPPLAPRLPFPLLVGAYNGQCCAGDIRLRFECFPPEGRLSLADGTTPTTPPAGATNLVEVPGPNGISGVHWWLKNDPAIPAQRVEVTLLHVGPPASPIARLQFTANLSLASQVAYDPGTCGGLAGQETVQRALDRLASQVILHPVSGDGQVGDPGAPLPSPVVVLAANRCGPVANMRVQSVVRSGGGSATSTNPPVAGETDTFLTAADGTASFTWTLGNSPNAQELEVTLRPTAGQTLAEPDSVRFSAHVRAAGEEPGVGIVGLTLPAAGRTLRLDDRVPLREFVEGIIIAFDKPLDFNTVADLGQDGVQPVCYVTVDVPFPLTNPEVTGWRVTPSEAPLTAGCAFRPFTLAATIARLGPGSPGEEDRIQWLLTREAFRFLERAFNLMATTNPRFDRLLARLTLKGNFILDESHELYLDGEAFRAPRSSPSPTGLRMTGPRISGDRRLGGDFEVWFSLVRAAPPVITLQPVGITVAVGSPVEFFVTATNALRFQWQRAAIGGAAFTDIAGATSERLVIPSVERVDAGAYRVVVSNGEGSVVSNTAALTVIGEVVITVAGDQIRFTNREPSRGLDAPVFAADGTTRLEGTDFMAALYVGQAQAPPALLPASLTPFRTGTAAGYWAPVSVSLPGFAAGNVLTARVRAWDARAGSYEAAEAAGLPRGESVLLRLLLVPPTVPPQPPGVLEGLVSFRLG